LLDDGRNLVAGQTVNGQNVFCDVLACSSMRHFVAIRNWLSEPVSFSKQGSAFGFAIATLATVAIFDDEVRSLGRTAISLRWSLFDELVLIW
jgi:hypothetical protein